MCQEVYTLDDQCNVHPDNVELSVNFDEVIGNNKPCDIIADHYNNSLNLVFVLMTTQYVRSTHGETIQ